MNNLMLDIETMGNSSEAAIMSIGACYFDPTIGEIGETFHEQINLETSVQAGMKLDTSTVLWWMSQDDEARSKFKGNGKAEHINHVLLRFEKFVKPNAQVWGNGIAFDNIIVNNAYLKTFGKCAPWKFWNDRDVRTIVAIGQSIGFDPKRDLPFEGVKHDALADSIHQARYVSLIWRKLTRHDSL